MANWGQKISKMTQSAITKSKEMAEVTRLNMEINTLEQNMKDVYTKIGEYVAESGLLEEDEAVKRYMEELNKIKEELEKNQEKIKDVRNINICSNCGAEVARTSKFCDMCGTEIIRISLEAEQKVCKNCNMPIEDGALFCGNCGTKQE